MNSFKKISSFLSALMILATLIPSGLAQNNSAFYIWSGVYDESSEVINVFWGNNINIQEAAEYSLSYEVFSHSAGIFEFAEPEVFLSKDTFQYTINPTVKNKQYTILMKAYDIDGNIINDDVITVFTDFAFSNTTYEYFSIDGGYYEPQNGEITVDWTSYGTPSDTAIDYYEITKNIYNYSSGDSEPSQNNIVSAPDSFLTFPALDGREYFISISAFATDGTFIGNEDITIDTSSGTPNNPGQQNYQGFGIIGANYISSSNEIYIFWEDYFTNPSDTPVNHYLLSYNVNDLNSGTYEYAENDIYIDGTQEGFTFGVNDNKEYFIMLDGYAADGTFIGSDDITVDTFGSAYNDPYDGREDYDDYDDYNEYNDYDDNKEYDDDFQGYQNTYFIESGDYDHDRGVIDVQWDPNHFPGIEYFQLYYDIYDFNGSYLHGSAAIDVPAETKTHSFQENYQLTSGEIFITVNAYDQYGLAGSDQSNLLIGDAPYDDYNDNYGYFPFLDISHSFGRYFVVDLTIGEKISFYAEQDGQATPNWLQAPNELLDCTTTNRNLEYTCTANKPGDTDVYFTINENGNEFSSPAIIVYIHDKFNLPSVCPVYPEPPCPNGNVYFPPAANGCLGQPVCKSQGGNIPVPTAGYEDEVKTVYDSKQNPFTDVNANELGGKAAIELFYRGVLGGFPDGELKGDRPVNRAGASKFLLLAKGIEILSGSRNNPFSDVPLGEWYTDFVLEAAIQGIIQGHPDKTFKAADGVLTAEFIAMLARTFDLPTGLPHDYKDEAKYKGAWFWDYAGIAKKYQLFPDRKDTLQPERPLTRYEVAIAIYQYLRNR
jgi:hypothetical protein